MSGPIKKAKTPGERAEWWERWALGAGLVVVIGLLIESGPELAHSIVMHEWPSRATSGNLIVVLGVAGEVIFSWRAVRSAREAELESEQIVAELQARTAEANLARVKIENKLRDKFKWRLLTREASEELITALLPYAGFKIDVFAFSKEQEVFLLADMLNAACRSAGCDSKLANVISDRIRIPAATGVVLAFAADATPEENDVMPFINMALFTALRKSGIECSYTPNGFRKTDVIEQETPPNSGFVPRNVQDIAPFRIQIAENSLLDSPWPVTPTQA